MTRHECPFCNTPAPRNELEEKEQLLNRIEKYNDPVAMNNLGSDYKLGQFGSQLNYAKAAELFQRASELGSSGAHYNLGNLYYNGVEVEQNKKKAIHHWENAGTWMLGANLRKLNWRIEILIVQLSIT